MVAFIFYYIASYLQIAVSFLATFLLVKYC